MDNELFDDLIESIRESGTIRRQSPLGWRCPVCGKVLPPHANRRPCEIVGYDVGGLSGTLPHLPVEDAPPEA